MSSGGVLREPAVEYGKTTTNDVVSMPHGSPDRNAFGDVTERYC